MLHAGTDPDRQSVGQPGHCDRCAEVGHVEAHPGLGCADVGCNSAHTPSGAPEPPEAAGPDLPDDPGYTGVYLVTAGALHRALGTIGHTAPNCQAEAENERLRAGLRAMARRSVAYRQSRDMVLDDRLEAEGELIVLRGEVVELRRAAADELSRLGQEGDLGGPRRVDDLDVAEAMLTNLRDADQSPGGRPAGGAREAGHIRSPWEGCTCVIFGTAYDVGELDPVCPRHGAGRSPAMDVDRE